MLFGCYPQRSQEELRSKIMREMIQYLANDSLHGRETGSEDEQKVASHLASRFQSMGYTAAGDSGYFQTFSKIPHPPVQRITDGDSTSFGMGTVKEVFGTNVIAKRDLGKESWIIIGAHHDHLGMGDENSLFTEGRAIHNGADDNASGVAMMMSIAEAFAEEELNDNVMFIAFSGEEKGLWGSNYFCDHPTIDLSKVKYMLNYDMVGRMKEDNTLAVYGNGTSPDWNDAIAKANKDSLKLVLSESGVGPSDHTSFYLEDIPVLHFFTGQHEDYHKPSDDWDKINYEGMERIYKFSMNLIEERNLDSDMPFTKTKEDDNENTPGFKVTLGVIPDYLYDGEGMRIDGVREERPAFNAGMIKGDVVLSMGEHAVTDMQTYMEGLSMFEEGDTTEVKFLRNEEAQTTKVIWD